MAWMLAVGLTVAAAGCDRRATNATAPMGTNVPAPTATNVPASSAATAANEVVLYCSTDEAFARPLLADFTKQTGIIVHPVFDSEAGKTTGLLDRLRAERHRPRADVWWSSEIFGTIALARAGALAACDPPSAADIPAAYRDANHLWTAFGLRGRVVVYDPKRVMSADAPKRWADFADPKYKGRIVIANPQFGTTRGHMASLCAAWGEPAFADYLRKLAANKVRLADGNAHCVVMVNRGQADIAWTDTDDAYGAMHRGDSIAMTFPDMDAPEGASPPRKIPGTLWIPNTVALVAGGPNPDAGARLIDFLASDYAEHRLAQSESANLPVRESLRAGPSVPRGPMAAIDYAAAAAVLERSDDLCREILNR